MQEGYPMHRKFEIGGLYVIEEYRTAVITSKTKKTPISVQEENRKNKVKNPKIELLEVYYKHTGALYRTRIKTFKEAQKYARKLDRIYHKNYKILNSTIPEARRHQSSVKAAKARAAKAKNRKSKAEEQPGRPELKPIVQDESPLL
jgi:hypothetical protein